MMIAPKTTANRCVDGNVLATGHIGATQVTPSLHPFFLHMILCDYWEHH